MLTRPLNDFVTVRLAHAKGSRCAHASPCATYLTMTRKSLQPDGSFAQVEGRQPNTSCGTVDQHLGSAQAAVKWELSYDNFTVHASHQRLHEI